MKVAYDPAFLKKLKKVDVRIRKSVNQRLLLFSKDPDNPLLDNHRLKRDYLGHRSIDITADWRAIYIETQIGDESVAYFVALGTHKQLFGKLEK